MVLALSAQQLAAMSAHAERVYPEECCGLMVGKILLQNEEGESQKRLIEIVPLDNEWTAEVFPEDTSTASAQPKRRRYSISPEDMLRTQRQAREQGLSIIGVYHSHPDHEAVPSECDRALAWPEYAYVIVSVRSGQAVDVKNWALDSTHQFQPEVMRISPSSARDRMPVSA
ncbi:MAG: Mov34/MPN/PAD-1 family protein [Phormidesmis sp.]